MTDALAIGQMLKVPTEIKDDQTNTYIVQKGDSLYSIAQKYNITVDELKSFNNLTSNTLSIGQKLNIPTTKNNTNNLTTYVVQKGDSLYSIAQKFQTTVDNLKLINNLTSNILSIGQILNIPSNMASNETYIVKSGDRIFMGNNE